MSGHVTAQMGHGAGQQADQGFPCRQKVVISTILRCRPTFRTFFFHIWVCQC